MEIQLNKSVYRIATICALTIICTFHTGSVLTAQLPVAQPDHFQTQIDPPPQTFAKDVMEILQRENLLTTPAGAMVSDIRAKVDHAWQLQSQRPSSLSDDIQDFVVAASEASQNELVITRCDETYKVNAAALARSGMFTKALESSPELRKAFDTYRFKTRNLRFNINQYSYQREVLASENAKTASLDGRQALSILDDFIVGSEAQLAIELLPFWERVLAVGTNGSQIAELRTANTPNHVDYVLLKSLGTSVNRNGETEHFGYSVTRQKEDGTLGLTTAPAEFLPPPPVDPDDLWGLASEIGTQRLSDGVEVKVTKDSAKNPFLQWRAMTRFGAFYDTGRAPAGSNFAQGVFLDGRDNPMAGQTDFQQLGDESQTDLDLLFNATVLSVADATVNVVGDFNNDEDVTDIRTRHLGAYGRFHQSNSRFYGWAVGIGTLPSLFSQTPYLNPNLFSNGSSLVGVGDRGNDDRPQLSLSIPVNESTQWRMGIEDPSINDIQELPAANLANTLQRWPTFATNLEFGDEDSETGSLRIGGIVRQLGFQDTLGAEHFGTGWGISAAGRIGSKFRSLLMGVSGGEGVGDYVLGVPNSAIFDAASVDTLTGYGTYIGIRNVRICNCKPRDAFTATYGYSWMETPLSLGTDVDQKLQQGIFNYVRYVNDYLAIGVQYEYGFRQIASGDAGENNRLLLSVALKTGKHQNPSRTLVAGYSTANFNGNENVVRAVNNDKKLYKRRF